VGEILVIFGSQVSLYGFSIVREVTCTSQLGKMFLHREFPELYKIMWLKLLS